MTSPQESVKLTRFFPSPRWRESGASGILRTMIPTAPFSIAAFLAVTLAGLTLAGPCVAKVRDRPTKSRLAAARALVQRCRPIDLHADTLWQVRTRRAVDVCDPKLQAGLHRLRMAPHDAQVWAIWASPREDGPQATRAALTALQAGRKCPGWQAIPTTSLGRAPVPEVRVLLAVEGGEALGGRAEALRDLADRGLLYVGPTWNRSNAFGDAAMDQPRHGGLSAEGRRLVKLAAELGVLVDVSHAADTTAQDVLRQSPLPVIASHSNARAVHDHPRNLSDDLIRAVARSGGVVGVNLHCPFVVRKGAKCDANAVARHVLHLRAVGGDGVLALGADFDGDIRAPTDLPDASALPRLVAVLQQRGLSEATLCGLLGDNVRRVVQAVRSQAARTGQAQPAGR